MARASVAALALLLSGCPWSVVAIRGRRLLLDRAVDDVEDCPTSAVLAGKGQCMDDESGHKVALACCERVSSCRQDLHGLLSEYVSRVGVYSQSCSFTQEDLKAVSEQNLERINISKACEPVCQKASAELPPLPNLEEFNQKCSLSFRENDMTSLKMAAVQADLVRTLDKFSWTCIHELPRVTALPPRLINQFWSACRQKKNLFCPEEYEKVHYKRCGGALFWKRRVLCSERSSGMFILD